MISMIAGLKVFRMHELEAWLGPVVSLHQFQCSFGLVTCWKWVYWWMHVYQDKGNCCI